MKYLILVLLVLMLLPFNSSAEPFLIEQANANAFYGKLEISSGAEYFYLNWASAVNNTFTRNDFLFPVAAKYGISHNVELKAETYLNFYNLAIVSRPVEYKNGFYPLKLQGKWGFLENAALAFSASIPLSNPDNRILGENVFYTGEGVNISVLSIFSSPAILNFFVLHANVGLLINGKYKRNNIDIEPSNSLMYGLSLEYIYSDKLIFNGEIQGFVFNEMKQNAAVVPNSSGNVFNVFFGMQYYENSNLKLKLGIVTAMSKAEYRNYDIGIISGISYLFNLGN